MNRNGSPLRAIFHRSALTKKGAGEDAPLRSDLFSASQMEQHGRTLAARTQWARIVPRRGCWQGLPKMKPSFLKSATCD